MILWRLQLSSYSAHHVSDILVDHAFGACWLKYPAFCLTVFPVQRYSDYRKGFRSYDFAQLMMTDGIVSMIGLDFRRAEKESVVL